MLFAAVDPTASRLFFSDANISFRFPNHWTLQPNFPYGPLFTKTVRDGTTAYISCAISAPTNEDRISADISAVVLRDLARSDLKAHQPAYRAIAEQSRRVAGQNAFEITWENVVDSHTLRHQTFYFYVQNRVYALNLEASPRTFKWALPDFQNWISSLRVLSRKDSGALTDPAKGGLWIHQTGGIKVRVPDDWLIAVSDDRTLGVALAQGSQHVDLTATVDLSSPTAVEFSKQDKKEALAMVHKKGLRIVQNTTDAFHGLPAFQVLYEGSTGERVIKGMDVWVITPKARWLFNLEGDVSLYNSLAEQLTRMLNNIEFI